MLVRIPAPSSVPFIWRTNLILVGFHTNTERGYLHKGMKPKLEKMLAEEWAKVSTEERGKGEGFDVEVSECDKDPMSIV